MSDGESIVGEESANPSGKIAGSDILARQIRSGLNELTRPASGLFLSGLSAGLDIGFSPLFMATLLTTIDGAWGKPLTEIVVACAYTVGFVFVVLGRSELFTEHTTLAVLPVLDRRASLAELGRLWGVVYAGNLAGALAFGFGAVALAPEFGMAERAAFAEIGAPLVAHPPPMLFAAAVLAGWLMGLLSWLVAAAQDTLSRVFFVWLVTVGIGLGHLPHSVAGAVEVFAAMLVTPAVTVVEFLGFVAIAAAGNAVGGTVFVALLKYGHVVRGGE